MIVIVVGGGVLVLYAYFISLSSKMGIGVRPWVVMGFVVCFATTWWLPQD